MLLSLCVASTSVNDCASSMVTDGWSLGNINWPSFLVYLVIQCLFHNEYVLVNVNMWYRNLHTLCLQPHTSTQEFFVPNFPFPFLPDHSQNSQAIDDCPQIYIFTSNHFFYTKWMTRYTTTLSTVHQGHHVTITQLPSIFGLHGCKKTCMWIKFGLFHPPLAGYTEPPYDYRL